MDLVDGSHKIADLNHNFTSSIQVSYCELLASLSMSKNVKV